MSDFAEWETAEPKDITLKGLTDLCNSLIKLRETKSSIESELESVQENIKEYELKILNVMKENAIPNFKGEFGTISIKNNKSVSQPENFEEKLKFFEYLKSEGLFEEMVSVNSRTLSSWANKEIEAREKQGVFGWVPPGLKPPTEYQSLSVRKK